MAAIQYLRANWFVTHDNNHRKLRLISTFMKKIIPLFPVITLESIVEDHLDINEKLIREIETIFDSDNPKRVLSHKWNNRLITQEKHKLGYTNFNNESLIDNSKFDFFFDSISIVINGFFEQLNYLGNWHFVNAWASVYPPGAYVPLHDHKPMHWSGVYYVKALPECGNILFTDPKEYALQVEPPSTMYRGNQMHAVSPVSGNLLLFPGYLKHETLPNDTNEDRIIISFNILTGAKGDALWQQ